MSEPSVRPSLSLLGAEGLRCGEERFALLAAIERDGSIAAAARAAGLSYKAAWAAVHALNNLFPQPLVLSQSGGRRGGGARLTEDGRQVLRAHRQLSASLARVLGELESTLQAAGGLSLNPGLLWSIGMKTSARNTYHGIVGDITEGAVNSEVVLRISGDASLVVILTRKSARELGLRIGAEAFALIKASAPILMVQDGPVRVSARNRLCGTVRSVERGAVNSEVVLDLGGGKTLVAVVTRTSAETLALEVGDRVCALVKASQIILGVSAG